MVSYLFSLVFHSFIHPIPCIVGLNWLFSFQGGKNKKGGGKSSSNEDKREHNYKHHDHGDKHFHDKYHAFKPIITKESEDDKIGAELLHLVEEEKKHHHQQHHHGHHGQHPHHNTHPAPPPHAAVH